MAERQLQRFNYTHEALINWIIANPHRYLQDAAAFFEVTPSWLSLVVNSDMFQKKLAERQEEVFGLVAGTIQERIAGAATLGLEKVARHISESEDKKYVLDATEKMLRAAGFGGKQVTINNTSVGNTSNTMVVSAEDLRAAREQRFALVGKEVEDVSSPALPPPLSPSVVEGDELDFALPAFDYIVERRE